MNNTILGLDVSTSTVGVCLMDENGKLIELTHITPKVKKPLPESKLEILFKKSDIVTEFLSKYKKMNVKRIIIEEPLLNSNNIRTCNILVKFNGMIAKSVFDTFGITSDYISSYDARKYGFPELMKPRTHKKNGTPVRKLGKPVLFGGHSFSADKKHIIWEKVADLEPSIIWDYNRHNIISKYSYDRSDAYTAILGFMKKEQGW